MIQLLKKLILCFVVVFATSTVTVSTAEAQGPRVRNAQATLRNLCVNLDSLERLLNIFGDLRNFLAALRGLLDGIFRPPSLNPSCLGIPNLPGFDLSGLLACLQNSIQINPNFQLNCSMSGPALTFNDPRACLSIPDIGLEIPNLEDLLNQCVQPPIFDAEGVLQQIQGLLEGLLDPVLNFRIPLSLPGLFPQLRTVCRDFGYLGNQRRARLRIATR